MTLLPAFATIDDLSDRLPGGVGDGDSARAQAALDDASALIRSQTGKTWVEAGELVDDLPDIVRTICCRAALRAFTNPQGVSQDTAGPFSTSYVNGSSDVYLTSGEKDQLRSLSSDSGAFAIDTVACDATSHSLLCALNFGAAYCSCGASIAGEPIYELDL